MKHDGDVLLFQMSFAGPFIVQLRLKTGPVGVARVGVFRHAVEFGDDDAAVGQPPTEIRPIRHREIVRVLEFDLQLGRREALL